MTLNITEIATMTQEQAILEFHKSFTVPSLIILQIITISTLIIMGMIMASEKSKKKFWGSVLITTIVISIATLIFLILLPETTQNIISAVLK